MSSADKTKLNNLGISGTASYVPKFTAGTTIGNSLMSDNGDRVHVNSRLVVKGNGSSYNEGIRILPSTNGWSNVWFSADDTEQGSHAGGWLIGRRGANGGISGTIGDFTIEENDSSGKNLTIHKNSGGATLQGPFVATGKITSSQGFGISNKISVVYDTAHDCLKFVF
jgi:hypothetical protein